MKINKFLILILIPALCFWLYSCESNDSPVSTTGEINVTLLIPPNNGIVNNLNPTFNWTQIASAERYRIQIASEIGFTQTIIDSSDINSTSFTITEAILQDSTTYYWRVQGYSPTNTLDWTPVSNFTTNTVSVTPNGKILIELFTNTSCIPCVPVNVYFDNIFERQGITNNDANVVFIRMHTDLFLGDPFYEFNIPVNDARIQYYSAASSNPRSYMMGAFMGAFNSGVWTNSINARLAQQLFYAVRGDNSFDPDTRNGELNVQISQTGSAEFNSLRLFVAVVENHLQFNAQNGETNFNNTLRDFITSVNGDPISLSLGQSVARQLQYSLRPGINENNAQLVIFVQNYMTREVVAIELINVN